LDLPQTTTLYGPRRCGKTYLFYQTIQELLNKGMGISSLGNNVPLSYTDIYGEGRVTFLVCFLFIAVL
jgi:predicted AAA+ superfamily ATPase